MDEYSYLSNGDIGNFEQLYQQFQQDPESVDPSWQTFFAGFEFAKTNYNGADAVQPEQIPETFQKEVNVINLIGAYRQRGHLFAKTNPIRPRRLWDDPIVIENFNLNEVDLDTEFQAGMRVGLGPAKLRDILKLLATTYCGTIGAEYKFVRKQEQIRWLESQMEECRNTPKYSKSIKKEIYQRLEQAVDLESYLHTKFVGQKRFSLEGAEAIIPALDTIVEIGARLGVAEFVFGMAHRGRLNVLANILGKSYTDIFTEFEGKALEDSAFAGDVKYHMGYSNDRLCRNGQSVHLSLAPNPSHLETVNAVVVGMARAKIEKRYGGDEKKLVPILIHGDAAISGQGINYEVLQMSQSAGYQTGGSVHVVLNNQIGFTTDYIESRSSTYCTDLAKVTLSPVFHVNGDDIESVVYVIQLALEFRQKFHRDVFVDILSYRKHGHNEADEPRFTQPTLYKLIAKHPNPKQIYRDKLIQEGSFSAVELDQIDQDFRKFMDTHLQKSKEREAIRASSFFEGDWSDIRLANQHEYNSSPVTGIEPQQFVALAEKLCSLPAGWKIFPKIRKLYQDRLNMVQTLNRIDWGMAENMAYATLLTEGINVRISGQDVCRGTFAHRHVTVVEEDDSKHFPLQTVAENQGEFFAYNSILSEYGVLGFEYGYAMSSPHDLTIWEAQFGDFVNGAQIIIDQFIAAAETKWQRMSGLTIFLPHGYEGQGPEHSSARVERFMILCAENNMQIINPTTPANLYHALRRQVKRPFRKPLIVFTPKSLLRHPLCVSSVEEMTGESKFQEILDDVYVHPPEVQRVLLCNGKVYYDLLAEQQMKERKDIALVRIEQLYPLGEKQIQDVFARYNEAKQWVWVQEEPENMGAWGFIARKFPKPPLPLRHLSRKESSTPSTGFSSLHKRQQEWLVKQAFY